MKGKKHKYAVKYFRGQRYVSCQVEDSEATLTLYCKNIDVRDYFPEEAAGGFVINEWKQVLRPDEAGEEWRCIRELPHDFVCRFSYGDRVFDNSRCDLEPGDAWPHHEVGVPHSFDVDRKTLRREVYSKREEITLPGPIREAFRQIGRRSGRCHVNEHRVVILPRKDVAGLPVFVTKVEDSHPWFEKPKDSKGKARFLPWLWRRGENEG